MKQKTEIIPTKHIKTSVLDDRIILGEKVISFGEILSFTPYYNRRFKIPIMFFSFFIIASTMIYLWYLTSFNHTGILVLFVSLSTLVLLYLDDLKYEKFISINKLDGTSFLFKIKSKKNSFDYQELCKKHQNYKINILNEWTTKELEDIIKKSDSKASTNKWDTRQMKQALEMRTFFMLK